MTQELMSAAMLRGLDTETLMIMSSQISDELERRYIEAKKHQIERVAEIRRQQAEASRG